jgi:hypothetical protein
VAGATYSPEKPSPVKRDQHQYSYQIPSIDSPGSSFGESFDIDRDMMDITQSPTINRSQARTPSLEPIDSRNLSTPLQTPTSSTTPKEDLLLSSDYNSVFKSRPKIALSPKFSPSGGTPKRVTSLTLMPGVGDTPEAGYPGRDSDDDEHASSPLKMKSERRRRM